MSDPTFTDHLGKPTANHFSEQALLMGLRVHYHKHLPEAAHRFILDNEVVLDLFTKPTCRDLFICIEKILAGGDPVDLAALYQKMADQAALIEYEAISTAFVSDANMKAHVKQLKECRTNREIQRLTLLSNAATTAGDLIATKAYLSQIESLQRNDRPTTFKPLADLLNTPPADNWLVKNLIFADSGVVMFGESGTCKTFVAIDLLGHIASSKYWLGNKTKAGKVLYVCAEGQNGIVRRFKAWFQAHGNESAAANIMIRTIPAALSEPAATAELANEIAAMPEKPVAIVFDTLARNFGDGDENATRDMNRFVAGMDSIRAAAQGATVIVIHHTGHDKSRERGAYALRAGIDTRFQIERNGDLVTMKTGKQKDGEEAALSAWNIQKQNLPWADEDGEPMNSLVLVRNIDHVPPECSALFRPLPAAQRIALESLEAALVTNGIDVEEAPGVASVAEDQWREAAYEAGISSSDSTDRAKRQAFQRARIALVSAKRVATQKDRYWIPAKRDQRNKAEQSGTFEEHVPLCSSPMREDLAEQSGTLPFKGVPQCSATAVGTSDPETDPATGFTEIQNVPHVPLADPTPDPTPASQTQTLDLDAIDRALVNAATAQPKLRRDLGRIAGYPDLADLDQRINKLRLAGLLAMQSGKLIKGSVLLL